jgi:hypothetical protein
MLSKKIANTLFGKHDNLDGKNQVRESLTYPQLDGSFKTIYWEGNKGLIITLVERIEELEKKLIKK